MENSTFTATAVAFSNIAFIKYWGNRDDRLRLPSNGSISMNLDGLETRTRVTFDASLQADTLILNDQPAGEEANRRVSTFLDTVRHLASQDIYACVESWNNFPTGAGIASSASAFAALALATSQAIKLNLSETDLSRLARLGSGSACRSIPSGFVEWKAGIDDASSYAETIAAPDYWDLVDCIAIVNPGHKATISSKGHSLATTSPLQVARIADAPRRLDLCRSALLSRDFDTFAEIVEQDSNLMHAVMMTSTPPLFYWEPTTLQIMQATREARRSGLPVCYTIDAGPNVHILTLSSSVGQVKTWVNQIQGVKHVIIATPGGPAHLIEND